MRINIEELRKNIENIAQKHNLILVLLFGSQARQKEGINSDVDIAVLGREPINFEKLVELTNEFSEIIKGKEIDVKSLHYPDPLFRYRVIKEGILLYGKSYDYYSFKAMVLRQFYESKDLLKLKEILVRRRVKGLINYD